MNYSTQLKTWAIEKVIASGYAVDMETLTALADKLVTYAYSPEPDLQDCVKRLQTLIKGAEAEEARKIVNTLLLELGAVQEDIERQISMQEVVNDPKLQ